MGDEKQTVLLVHNYYQIPGGEDTVVANEKKMLEDYGHKVLLYSRNNSELSQMSKLQKLLLPFTTIFNVKSYTDVKRLIKNEHIDIIHVHNTLHLISPSIYYAAFKCKIPVVQTIHNFRMLCPGATFYRDGHICEDCVEYSLNCAVKHRCYRNSRIQTLACVMSTKFHRMTGIYKKINYICLTEFNKEKILTLKQVKENKVFVKPNFVKDVSTYIPEDQRNNQFIFVGRLDKLKGVDILLEAWKHMGADAPKLVVCGTGPMEDWCKEFVAKNECNVELKGFIPNTEARKLIANSRALILPTQWYEGFPMSIVEAYSVGTPVICSNLGNAGSIVEEGITGCKFKFDSKDELIAAVQKCNGLCESTLGEYKKKYTEKINYKMIRDLYMRLSGEYR